MKKGEIDLLAGGPPCQSFSVFGKRSGLDDERGKLVFEYIRLIKELKPKAFVFENVPGITTADGGKAWEQIKTQLERPAPSLRYYLNEFKLEATNYLVPQNRDRVFVIGSLGKIDMKPPPFWSVDSPKNGTLQIRSVLNAFSGLSAHGAPYSVWPKNRRQRNHSQRIIDRYAGLDYGERDSHTRINKLHPDKPSFTIIVGSNKGGGKGHVHPFEPREVTPRESARIQTFPDWWAFSGGVRHEIRQIGNAVPPLLGAAVGNAIRHQVFGYEEVPLLDILTELDQKHLLD